ncbi:MAG TPA: cob(I)yrinic acid a,c-diamide adenosyltransferase [Steroidobacteraceae bacterium]|jgi:cob(I)alamin adenosyltransferase
MGHRLSKIYTRTGDQGTTGLGDGERVAKTHARIEAYGTVDEASSAIGMVLAVAGIPDNIVQLLTRIQHELFDLGSELAVPGYRVMQQQHIDVLEQQLDLLNEDLPMLKEFILPGGGPSTAACHLARTITRRAERAVWKAMETETVAIEVPQYLNRLSDLLFVIARVLVRHERGAEVLWKHDKSR